MVDGLRPCSPAAIYAASEEQPGPKKRKTSEEPLSLARGRAINVALEDLRMQHEHDIEVERRIGRMLDVTVQAFCAAWVIAHLIAVASLLLDAVQP